METDRRNQISVNHNSFKMRSIFFKVFFLITLVSFGCQTADTSGELIKNINDRLSIEKGAFAVAFKDLSTGKTILINENESFHAASTMKTPVMVTLYKQASEGKFELNDSILIKDEFYSIVDSSVFKMDIGVDSEGRLYEKLGRKLPIKDLIFEMITMSSNLATNLLIDLVDARNVTNDMRALGAENMQVLRGVEDLKAFEKGLSNTTTALDLLIIYEKLAGKEIISDAACEEMIAVLKSQHFNDMIPLLLPEDITVAHKTGSITGVHHDSGIVYLPNGKNYVLILLSKNLDDFDKATQALAEVSKMIYDFTMAH